MEDYPSDATWFDSIDAEGVNICDYSDEMFRETPMTVLVYDKGDTQPPSVFVNVVRVYEASLIGVDKTVPPVLRPYWAFAAHAIDYAGNTEGINRYSFAEEEVLDNIPARHHDYYLVQKLRSYEYELDFLLWEEEFSRLSPDSVSSATADARNQKIREYHEVIAFLKGKATQK